MPEVEHRPADMPRHAAAFVARVASARLPLDYSVASLRVVDRVVDGLRQAGSPGPRLDAVLFGLGAYVGEVLVRRAGAEWIAFDASQRDYFGQDVGVRMPDGRVRSPLGKVANRYTAGAAESLQTFYLTLPGRRRRACAAAL
ncbi:hypothetical protein [Streptomyces sp. NPDC050145]|uniref:hypothetical protein n=1 Tax=Streptomyces sp. NPDC050145 TaxID=3365602 RepID=UPI00378CB149